MKNSVLVSGSTGFTGSFVCRELLKRGIQFDCLVRVSSQTKQLKSLGLHLVEGDLNDLESLRRILTGYQIFINVASLGLGSGPNIVKACQESGIKRTVFVSTTAIFTKLNAQSKVVRQAAEEAIRELEKNVGSTHKPLEHSPESNPQGRDFRLPNHLLF